MARVFLLWHLKKDRKSLDELLGVFDDRVMVDKARNNWMVKYPKHDVTRFVVWSEEVQGYG